MLSVSALSSYVHCPRQFFVHYVRKEALPPRDVIVLGLIKHKVYESLGDMEERLVCSLMPDSDVHAYYRTNLVRSLQDSVKRYKNALRQVNVPLVDAFKRCLPAVEFEARDRALPVSELLRKGLHGQDLWEAISPKIKHEYPVKSSGLGLSGRIDRLACYPSGVVPVELKSGRPPDQGVWDSHRIQVVSYAMMLSEKFGVDVDRAVVHYVDKNVRREVVVNPFLKGWVLDVRDSCLALMGSSDLPKGCGKESCPYCKL